MASGTDTQTGRGDLGVEGADTVSSEVKVEAVRAILSEGAVEVSEVLSGKRGETLALVQRLLASAGIEGALSVPEADTPNEGGVEPDKAVAPDEEIPPEQAWFGEFESRFNAHPDLHPGIQYADVKRSLDADPEAVSKLMKLDAAGFEMNVFGEKNGEIQFRTAQMDVAQIAPAYRTIMYDQKAQTDYPQYKVNGNAEDIVASMGVELADIELYEQLRVDIGWVWLKTDAATRITGSAFGGDYNGISKNGTYNHDDSGSFCAALRVKKV